MKRKMWVVGGSVGAGVLLILMAFTSIVNAQTTKMTFNDTYQITKNDLLIKKINTENNTNLIEYLLAFLLQYIIYPIIYLIVAILGSLDN